MLYKVIDFECKGNVVRFYLGQTDLDMWYGDDWDDVPYEHNAERVYPEYVSATIDVAYPIDCILSEPCDGHINSSWSKDDMRERRVCAFVVLDVDDDDSDRWRYEDSFEACVAHGAATRVFFGDVVDPDDVTSWAGASAHRIAFDVSKMA